MSALALRCLSDICALEEHRCTFALSYAASLQALKKVVSEICCIEHSHGLRAQCWDPKSEKAGDMCTSHQCLLGGGCRALSSAAQVQCVMQFLRLPIEDDLAEISPQQPIGISLNGSGPVLGPSEQPIPFADTGNPIMAQVNSSVTSDAWPTPSPPIQA